MLRRRGGGSGQHVVAGRAGVDQLLAGSAPALRGQHHVARAVMRSTWACPPSLPAGLPAGSSRSSTSFEVDVAVPVSATTAPSTPPCITALRSASEYYRSPPRTRITEGVAGFAAALPPPFCPMACPRCLARRRARAQQHRPHRLGGVRGARHQRLLLPVQHNHRRGDRVCLLPQPRMAAECGLARRLVQLRLGGNHVRRPLPAQSHVALPVSPAWRPARLPPAAALSTRPGRLHVAVRKGVARLLRYIHLVGRQLQAAVLDARALASGAATRPRPRTPLCPAVARIGGCGCAPGFRRGCSKSTTWPSSSADCTSGAPQVCVPPRLLLPCSLLPCSLAPLFPCSLSSPCRRKLRLQPVAACCLPGSRGGRLLDARVAHAGHRAQRRIRPKRAGHLVGGQLEGAAARIAAPAFAGNHHAARAMNGRRLHLPWPRVAEVHVGHRRAPGAAHVQWRIGLAARAWLRFGSSLAIDRHAALQVRVAQLALGRELQFRRGRGPMHRAAGVYSSPWSRRPPGARGAAGCARRTPSHPTGAARWPPVAVASVKPPVASSRSPSHLSRNRIFAWAASACPPR